MLQTLIGFALHTFGVVIYAGGVIWVTIINILAQKSPRPHGKAFYMEIIGTIRNLLVSGIVLLSIGGILRLSPFLGFLTFATIWGTMMIIKLLLVAFVFANGMYVGYGLAPRLLAKAPRGPNEGPSPEFIRQARTVARLSQANFPIVIVILVISVLFRAVD